MKPSYEQLEQDFQRMKEENSNLKELLRIALDRIAELEKRLDKNSKNSSKPPSTDQKSNTPKRPKSARKPRKGKARVPYPPERVDHHVQCTREKCPYCSSPNLQSLSTAPATWQQVELPPVHAVVTQYNCQRYRCEECKKHSIGGLPDGVPSSAFGPKLMALIGALTGRFHLAKREAMLLVSDLYGINLSVGSIINVEENVANSLEEVYERIHRCATASVFPRYLDETSWRDSGKRHYVWTVTTAKAAYYKIDPGRHQEVFLRIVGPHTKQPSVTDRYAVYNALDGPHQYCFAHLIRDFHAFGEEEGETGQIGRKIEQELRTACKIHAKWRSGEISKQQKSLRLAHSKRRLKDLFVDGMLSGNKKLDDLCTRLDEKQECLWAFASIEGMEPTNNMAERSLRSLVLWRKKSYGTRSPKGQRYVERISSAVETLKKNGKNVLAFLEEAVRDFIRGKPAPFMVSELGI